jgi:predicted amidophosphoribosyltransferase
MIAKGLFLTDGFTIQSELLRRRKATRSQTEMGREERKANVRSAFFVPSPDKVKNKCIALVDDVVTTGATLNECARELKKAGAGRVVGLTIATPVIKQGEGIVY